MRFYIKRHPLAFLHLIGWLCLGAAFLYIMHYHEADYADIPLADMAVITAVVSGAIIAITQIIGILCRLLRRRDNTGKAERRLLREVSKSYMQQKPYAARYYFTLAAICLLPLMAVLSVTVSEIYVAGILCMTIGVSIWLIFVCMEMPEGMLFSTKDAEADFSIMDTSEPAVMDALYRESAMGVSQAHWESRRDYVYHILRSEGLASANSSIAGYRIPADAFEAHYNVTFPGSSPDTVVWIPLSKLNVDISAKTARLLRRLLNYQYDAIVDLRYAARHPDSSEGYHYSDANLRLQPSASATVCEKTDGLHILAASAADPTQSSVVYRCCDLALSDAKLLSVAYDDEKCYEPAFEACTDDQSHFSADDALNLFYLLLEGAFEYEIYDFTYLPAEQRLQFGIWVTGVYADGISPTGGSGLDLAAIEGEFGLIFSLSYEAILWRWMDTLTK